MKRISVQDSKILIQRSLKELGIDQKHIDYIEHALIQTSLKGIDTHGLRLLPLYIKEFKKGRAKTKPDFQFLNNGSNNIMQMNADASSGVVAGMVATEKCIELANQYGIGAVAVKNSNHFGAASVYGDYIAKNNLIGIVTSSAAPRVVPFQGREKLFGTDPLCFTAPMNEEEIFSLDMATSQVCYSKIKEYKRRNIPLKDNWAVDKDGNPEKDPEKISALFPLGGYKGQGLSMMVQILSALLAGGAYDFQLSHLDEEPYDKGRGISHFFMAIKIDSFLPLDIFKNSMREYIGHIKGSLPVEGKEIMFPGEPEQRERKKRMTEGILLTDQDFYQLNTISSELGVELPV